jgi:hypothetical protein
MKTSESIAKISPALVGAKQHVKNAVKDATNPFFNKTGKKPDYATLESVLDAITDAIKEAKIFPLQSPEIKEDGGMVLTTRLIHETGEWIEWESPLLVTKNDMQGIGSAITYMRRFSLAAAFGITQVDDDGNAASSKDTKPPEEEKQKGKGNVAPPKAKSPDKSTVEKLLRSLSKIQVSESAIKLKYNIKTIDELTVDQLNELSKLGAEIKAGSILAKDAFPLPNHAPQGNA